MCLLQNFFLQWSTLCRFLPLPMSLNLPHTFLLLLLTHSYYLTPSAFLPQAVLQQFTVAYLFHSCFLFFRLLTHSYPLTPSMSGSFTVVHTVTDFFHLLCVFFWLLTHSYECNYCPNSSSRDLLCPSFLSLFFLRLPLLVPLLLLISHYLLRIFWGIKLSIYRQMI